ncbi:MAG: hypothetical protein KDB88_10280, partial [Flavobacteriales bacterium]|nr:hypothetical protein [Flavobacteriales bacterium]
ERVLCDEVRALKDRVDWPCELHTRFNRTNMGLRLGVSSAIDWFFEHEEEGIVLEDDTLPVPSFFRFCQELLERYRDDNRIWVVMGNNLMDEWKGARDGDYWFSAHGYGAPWGWASWRRAWSHYDVTMAQWPELKRSQALKDFYLNRDERREVNMIFDLVHSGQMNSWSYQFDITRITNQAVNILPEQNLITNIGFGEDGTHTVRRRDRRNKDTAADIRFPLNHPGRIHVDRERDEKYFMRYINTPGLERFKWWVKDHLPGGDENIIVRTVSSVRKKLGVR